MRRLSHRGRSLALAAVLGGCGGGGTPTPLVAESAPEQQSEPAPESEPDTESQRMAAVHYHSAFELDKRGAQAEAFEAVQRALGLHRTNDALLLGSKLAISQEKMGQAREWTEELIRRDPEHVSALYNLGVIAHRSDKYNEARSSYLAALRVEPNHADARYNLVVLTANAGVTEEAKFHRDKFVAAHPQDSRVEALAKLLGERPGSPTATATP